MTFDTTFPPPLAALHRLRFDYADGDGMDFEPYDKFLPAAENASWLAAWTGNRELDGHEYRVFGQDGTGGYVAFWMVRKTHELLDQPVVFFGSEGELAILARNFADYLWLLAGGQGPYEVTAGYPRKPHPDFTLFATEHAPTAARPGAEIVAAARAEFPTFEADVRALCR
ncbi:MAG: hypothetical protein KBG28_06955 [Kofleriaceae bacterium]|nr:hypothetical protein [Kofleriaceae bacterium]MBP6837199.1 hypothetical protein [Kofleriaceae bacterium]MBP9203682.1 hypothetical protein [Kofleriaceae bacterium]